MTPGLLKSDFLSACRATNLVRRHPGTEKSIRANPNDLSSDWPGAARRLLYRVLVACRSGESLAMSMPNALQPPLMVGQRILTTGGYIRPPATLMPLPFLDGLSAKQLGSPSSHAKRALPNR